jgi:hypothetical protein
MIGYCPLEDIEPEIPKKESIVERKDTPKEVGVEETECNYVVMAFIAGVLFLAVSDSIRA